MSRLLVFFSLFPITAFMAHGQEVKYDLPEGLEVDIKAGDYGMFLDTAVAVVKGYAAVDSVAHGTIYLAPGSPYMALNVDNLLLRCFALPDKKEWPALIREHFDRGFASAVDAEEVDMDSYTAVKPYLAFRVYNAARFAGDSTRPAVITTTHLAGTTSVLMLDMPTAFRTIEPTAFAKWDQPVDSVFREAQRNVDRQPMEIVTTAVEIGAGDSIPISFIENEDYAASYAMGLNHTHPELLGPWGAAIAMPNKGIALLCAIGPERPLDFVRFIQAFNDPTQQFFAEHPQPVSEQFFWYYNGRFTPFSVQVGTSGEVNVVAPAELSMLLAGGK